MSEAQARAVVGILAFIIAVGLARLIWGDRATLFVYGLFIVWLLWHRVTLDERVDDATAEADIARADAAEARAEAADIRAHLEGQETTTGRHSQPATAPIVMP